MEIDIDSMSYDALVKLNHKTIDLPIKVIASKKSESDA
jgi:hypothetical protein